VADGQTLEALIANRYEMMASYARGLRSTCEAELARVKAQGATDSQLLARMRLAQRWLHRDDDKIPVAIKAEVAGALEHSPVLEKLVAMREELRLLWTRSNVSADQLVADLQAWCHKAEQSGIATLQQFSLQLRAVRV
jgi:stearoyl-CoA desaturase (delta-9 desaturase)